MKVLIVAAHADDEVLGAGGAIFRHILAGDSVRVLICADCRTVRDKEAAPALHPAALEAATVLGHTVHFLGFRGMELAGHVLALTQAIERELVDSKPDVVYTHLATDLNSDHRAVSYAVMVATRPFGAHQPKRVLHFEIPSSTGFETPSSFAPNVFMSLEDAALDRKLCAIQCYREEMRLAPHPRSIEALEVRAKYWGQQAGMQAAEPFMLMREIS